MGDDRSGAFLEWCLLAEVFAQVEKHSFAQTAMKPWLQFAVWLLTIAITAGITWPLAYRKGRIDEIREWGKDEVI